MELQENISISNILSESFRLWKQHFARIASITFIVYLPVQIIIELISIFFEPTNLESAEDWRKLGNEIRIYDFVRQVIGVIATLGILNLTLSVLKGEDPERPWTYYLKYGALRWPQYIWVATKAGLTVLLYLLLLIIPGIYKAVRFSFVDCAFVDNDDAPLQKSERLVDKRWFTIFMFVTLVFLIGLGIELIIAIPFLALPDSHLSTLTLGIVANILTSYTIVVRAKYYKELNELNRKTMEENNENISIKDQA
jgi:hypothetical protein